MRPCAVTPREGSGAKRHAAEGRRMRAILCSNLTRERHLARNSAFCCAAWTFVGKITPWRARPWRAWCLMAMCLERRVGPLACIMQMDPELSMCKRVGSRGWSVRKNGVGSACKLMLHSAARMRSHWTCLLAVAVATYSASADESLTVVCIFDDQ